MHAVIVTGGKQYRVKQGDKLKVEKLDSAVNDTIEFSQVLMVSDGTNIQVGSPYVAGSKVTATVLSHGRGEKIRIVKVRRRKNYRRQAGHRQHYTELQITQVA